MALEAAIPTVLSLFSNLKIFQKLDLFKCPRLMHLISLMPSSCDVTSRDLDILNQMDMFNLQHVFLFQKEA